MLRRLEAIRRSVGHHLFQGGDAADQLVERRHPERLHSQADRFLLQLGRGCPVDHQFLEPIPERHRLVDRDPAAVAPIVALLAASRLVDGESTHLVRGKPRLQQRLFIAFLAWLLANLTEAAAEPLRQDQVERGGDQKGLDPHVEQSAHRTWGVIGVQGGEHQVSGQRRFDANLGGLEVPDLTDHDRVRVLTKKAPQRRGEGDRKSTRLNSSHGYISYAVFCLKKKKKKTQTTIYKPNKIQNQINT